jgi:hypothetical protein
LEGGESGFAVFESLGEWSEGRYGAGEDGFEGVLCGDDGFFRGDGCAEGVGGEGSWVERDAAGWVCGLYCWEGAEMLRLVDEFGEDEEVHDQGDEDRVDGGAENRALLLVERGELCDHAWFLGSML